MSKQASSQNKAKKLSSEFVDTGVVLMRMNAFSPLLEGEDVETFAEFQLACVNAIRPANAIEEVWLVDFINYAWDAKRLQRLKHAFLLAKRRKGLEALQRDHDIEWEEDGDLAWNWSEGEEDAVGFVEASLKDRGLNQDAITAYAFQLNIEDIEKFDKLITFYELRRDKAIKELEGRCEKLASHTKEFAQNIEDAEFVEIPQAAE